MVEIIDDLQEIIKIIVEIIVIIIMIYVGYQVLRAIFGGTWTTENIIIAGMGIILTGMFVIVGFLINQGHQIGEMKGKLEEHVRKHK